jgi:hypothetical protein
MSKVRWTKDVASRTNTLNGVAEACGGVVANLFLSKSAKVGILTFDLMTIAPSGETVSRDDVYDTIRSALTDEGAVHLGGSAYLIPRSCGSWRTFGAFWTYLRALTDGDLRQGDSFYLHHGTKTDWTINTVAQVISAGATSLSAT